MSYNVYEGAQDIARYERIKKLAKRHKVDVLCLQEANGWHHGPQSRLEDFATSTGLTEVAFGNSNTDSKLVIFSRLNILGFIVHTDGLYHCAIQAWIEGDRGAAEIVNYHGNPFHEDKRIEEVTHLASEIGRSAAWCGDFNSLSRHDKYPPTLLERLVELENERYGTTELRYDVTDLLALHGFIDVAADRMANVPTFPAMTGLEAFQQPTRFDYVFAREKAASAIATIEVIANPMTARTSDHHPLMFEIDESALAMPPPSPVAIEPSRAMHFLAA